MNDATKQAITIGEITPAEAIMRGDVDGWWITSKNRMRAAAEAGKAAADMLGEGDPCVSVNVRLTPTGWAFFVVGINCSAMYPFELEKS
jgi:hypothetical protein